MITPQQIAGRKFPIVWRGYDEKEVDAFLAQVAAAVAQLSAHTEADTQQLPPVPSAPPVIKKVPLVVPPPAPSGPSLESIALLLQNAQETAAKIQADAQAAADQTVRHAVAKGQQIIADAQAKADASVGAADRSRTELAQQITTLQGVQADVAAKMKAALAALLPPAQ